MTEEQANDMMLIMEQLAGDIRELTYAIRENNDPAGIDEIWQQCRDRVMKEKGYLNG